jgi:hypothetical protein
MVMQNLLCDALAAIYTAVIVGHLVVMGRAKRRNGGF